jgi:hypothetical protein
MIRPMCEQFVARAAEPFRLDALWPLAERMERWGIAGFGWGATWLAADGSLATHRDTRAFRDDPARDAVGANETTSLLVHLRRPSRLSTLALPDTQPFVDPAGRFAFAHNGELADTREARERYRAQGRITGRADTEVGQRWLEDAWPHGADGSDRDEAAEGSFAAGGADGAAVPPLLAGLHGAFGGVANLAVLAADGSTHHYFGNPENPVFAFRLGRIGVASTAVYSIDRSLFRYAAPGATDRALARVGCTFALDEEGRAILSGPSRRARGGAVPA